LKTLFVVKFWHQFYMVLERMYEN